MPIEPMDTVVAEQQSKADAFTLGMLRLWKYRFWIIGVAAFATIGTYCILRFALPEEFKTTAQVYSTRFNASDDARYPDVVAQIATSEYLLDKVRIAYKNKYNPRRVPYIEDFVKQFRTKTEVVQDTAVKKEFSPIIELSVQSAGREQTQFIMNTWLKLLIEEQGNYAIDEARLRLKAAQEHLATVEKVALDAEQRQAETAAQLVWAEKLLAEKMNQMAPSNLVRALLPKTQSVNDSAAQAGTNQITLNVDHSVQNSTGDPTANASHGLLYRLDAAKMDLAIAQSTGNTEEIQKNETLIQLLNKNVDETSSSVSQLQKRVAELTAQVSAATRDVEEARGRMREIHFFADRIEAIASSYYLDTTSELPAAGDIRVVAGSVVPDLRAWPKRTLISIGVGVTVTIFHCLWLLCALWLQMAGTAVSRWEEDKKKKFNL